MRLAFAFVVSMSAAVQAGDVAIVTDVDFSGADVVLLGEVHDNPLHHENQAAAIKALMPTALVFEMLSPAQAQIVNDMDRNDMAALEEALNWAEGSWPDFAMYHPLFLAAPEAPVYGAAIDRDDLIAAMQDGAATVFGDKADQFGLGPLPADQQTAREAFQMAAHCDALPEEMLSGMVEAQRLRDAKFSETALNAVRENGGPVVVITGNGHARNDWGMPVYIAATTPDVSVFSLAQLEEAASLDAPYDSWLITEAAEREDPCAVFQK